MNIFLEPNNAFQFGNTHHLTALSFFFLLGFGMIYLARNYLSVKQQDLLGQYFAYLLALTVIIWTPVEYYAGAFDYREDLPLYLCNLLALLMPWFARTKHFFWYEIILFWILAGTMQAVITPDLRNNFPHYNFLKYWTVHAGLIVMIFYATFVYGFRPTWKSMFKSFAALQVYFIAILIINYFLGANYAYLNVKPEVSSILDFFGPWPWYVIQGQGIVLPFFGFIYLPFFLAERWS